ncbi:hypothetical protein AGOR_G00238960 [Albula goreensis]|uniref:Ribonucleoprotein PTB-binding 1 n=1 Tax=Albula goreensis TaxID=1534307 RepID=A0A8T3CFP0_9TELE|nr:hypothetical protein AGOR_G00238960 [Albula goreensis]
MAAASSVHPPTVLSIVPKNSPLPDSDSPEVLQHGKAASEGLCLRELPDLEPVEIKRRLEETRRELSNRRKILIKNLPQDITNQEVHTILAEYELKYCYVDRNKGTAFVTLLNGDQAQDAIRFLHQTAVRGREITVQLQPTDALLCVTNLPHTFTAAQFQELARIHGNLERCFLAYSERTGHSKGYGFVEYMKKDSASRARSELLGHRHGDHTLMAQWADANRLTAELIHSRCLRVDRLPADLCDSEELARIFSIKYRPVFCQLAQEEDSHARGFAVLEYEMAEHAEAVLMEMDRQPIRGQEVHVSLCAPGTSGRSTLAALIAAQGMVWNSRKGLLPEPSVAQLLGNMSNPAALQALLRPPLHSSSSSKHSGKFNQPQGVPYLRPPLAAALFHLGKVQQNTFLGNGLILQNLLQIQLAQQQLLHIKDKHMNPVSSLLGDPSRVLLQKALGLQAAPPPPAMGQRLLGGSPTKEWSLPEEVSQDAAKVCGQAPVGYPSGRQPPVPPGSEPSRISPAVPPGPSPGPPHLAQSLTQGTSRPLSSAPKPQPNLHAARETSSSATSLAVGQTSLLGEPPKEVKLPSNPYLNLASVLPGMVLQGPSAGGKAQNLQSRGSIHNTNQYSPEGTTDYTQHYSPQYSQEAMQHWYQQYQLQGCSRTVLEGAASEYSKEHSQGAASTSYGDYITYSQAIGQLHSQPQVTPATAHTYHRDTVKEGDTSKTPTSGAPLSITNGNHPGGTLLGYSCSPAMSVYVTTHNSTPGPTAQPHTGQTAADWSQFYYSQTRGQKRDSSQLPVPDSVLDRSYVGLGGQYQDYSKKKRL